MSFKRPPKIVNKVEALSGTKKKKEIENEECE